MTRSATSRSDLLRHGFVDSDRTRAGMAQLGDHAEPLVALLGRTADPDLALAGLLRLVEAVDDPLDLLNGVADDEGTAMRLLSVLGASQALTDHLVRHPEQWHELTDPTLGSTRPAAYAVRAGLLAAVGADPLADAAGRHPAGGPGPRRDAGRVPPGAGPAGGPRPRPPRQRRRRGRRAVRPRGRHARRRARGRPGEGGGGRSHRPAGRDRDGQVRWARAQLRLGRRRDLRARAGGGGLARRSPPGRPPSSRPS